MRKVAVARCAFVVLTFTMLAASGADKTMTDKAHGFEITIPESWFFEKTPQTGFVLSAVSPKSKSSEYAACLLTVLVIDVEDRHQSKEYQDSFFASLKASINTVKNNRHVVENVESKLCDDVNALKITTIIERSDKALDMETLFHVVARKRCYVLGVIAGKDDYEKYSRDIDAIIKSFKLIDAK